MDATIHEPRVKHSRAVVMATLLTLALMSCSGQPKSEQGEKQTSSANNGENTGSSERPVSVEALSQLGYAPYGLATPNKLRLTEATGTDAPGIEFWFPNKTPKPGDFVGLKRVFTTTPGTKYHLTLDVFDGYKDDRYAKHIVQKITVDGKIVDEHDLSAPAFSGWRKVDQTFTAGQNETTICVFEEAAGPLEPWNWGYTAKTIIRGMKLDPVAG